LKADRRFFGNTPFSALPFSETYLPMPWASGWLLLGALLGMVCLVRQWRTSWFELAITLALFLQVGCILSFFFLAQRYTADLYPFLIFCFIIFLRKGGTTATRLAIIVLVFVSTALNSLATASWLGSDGSLPPQTHSFWNKVVGQDAPKR
jgi:hypothetical protein